VRLRVDIVESLDRIDSGVYQSFFAKSGASLYYDARFLRAAEFSPLLPVERVYYLIVWDGDRIVAFLPTYLQKMKTVDPLGVLTRTAALKDDGDDFSLFSHIMHCFDSAIPATNDIEEVLPLLLDVFANLAMEAGARYFGVLNVRNSPLLAAARAAGMRVEYMVDSYYVDLAPFSGFHQFVDAFPADGRREMHRQWRKFSASGATARVAAPPFNHQLKELATLCQSTTARKGTPDYFPVEPLLEFCQICGDLVRLSLVEVDGKLISGLICFEQSGIFHIWSAGMVYDRTDFSPYSISFAAAYQHAFEHGLRRVEGGRLNARIKTRLGLQPCALYSITSSDLKSPNARSAAPFYRELEGLVVS